MFGSTRLRPPAGRWRLGRDVRVDDSEIGLSLGQGPRARVATHAMSRFWVRFELGSYIGGVVPVIGPTLKAVSWCSCGATGYGALTGTSKEVGDLLGLQDLLHGAFLGSDRALAALPRSDTHLVIPGGPWPAPIAAESQPSVR